MSSPSRPSRPSTPELQLEFATFASRRDRTLFLHDRFKQYLGGTVLDVGCDTGVLRDIIGTARYCGVDKAQEADIQHDLEQGGPLPFGDSTWDTVLCAEVLEHLDNAHELWAELVRVTRHHLVVSLPNCWNHIRARLRRGHGSVWHYGLPADPPPDRHKWFFSLLEAKAFFEERAARDGLRIVELVAQEAPRMSGVRLLRRMRYPSRDRYLNRYANMLVGVFEPVEPPRDV